MQTVVTPKKMNIFFTSSTTAQNSCKFGLVNIDDDSRKVYVTNDYSCLELRDVYEDKGGQSNHFRIYFVNQQLKRYLTFQQNVAMWVYEVSIMQECHCTLILLSYNYVPGSTCAMSKCLAICLQSRIQVDCKLVSNCSLRHSIIEMRMEYFPIPETARHEFIILKFSIVCHV